MNIVFEATEDFTDNDDILGPFANPGDALKAAENAGFENFTVWKSDQKKEDIVKWRVVRA